MWDEIPKYYTPAQDILHNWEMEAERRRNDPYEREERRKEAFKRDMERHAECEANRAKQELLESDKLRKVISEEFNRRLKYLIENEGESLIHAIELAKERKARYESDFKEILDIYLLRIEMHNYAVIGNYCVLTHQIETGLNSPRTKAWVKHIEGWRYDEHNVYSSSMLGEINRGLPDGWGIMTEKALDGMLEKGRKSLYEAIRDDDSFNRVYTGVRSSEDGDSDTDEPDDAVTFWVESDGRPMICTLERGGRYSLCMCDDDDYYPMLLVKRGKEEVTVPVYIADSFEKNQYVFKTYPDERYNKILGDILSHANEQQKELLTGIAEGIREKYKDSREEK